MKYSKTKIEGLEPIWPDPKAGYWYRELIDELWQKYLKSDYPLEYWYEWHRWWFG